MTLFQINYGLYLKKLFYIKTNFNIYVKTVKLTVIFMIVKTTK